jgi:hypothetical protein
VSSTIVSIPLVLQLTVGIVGLIVTVSTRRRGSGTGLIVTAFALTMAVSVGWMIWLFAQGPLSSSLKSVAFSTYATITVNVALGVLEVAAWLMVVLGVLRTRAIPAGTIPARATQPAPPHPASTAPVRPPAPTGPGGPAGPLFPPAQTGPGGQPGAPGLFAPPQVGPAGPASRPTDRE